MLSENIGLAPTVPSLGRFKLRWSFLGSPGNEGAGKQRFPDGISVSSVLCIISAFKEVWRRKSTGEMEKVYFPG